MNRLRKFAELSPVARRILLYSVFLVAVVALGIRVCSVASCARYLARLGRLTGLIGRGLGPQEAARLVYAADSVMRARCLARSLVLGHILKVTGVPVQVRLGVSVFAGGAFSAHAWIELDGAPIGDAQAVLDRYAPFPPLAIGFDRASENCVVT